MVKTDWLRVLGYVTGLVNQELLLKNEYLVAENRILKAHIKGRLLLLDGEKATLAEIAKRVGRKALTEIARVAKPDTILAWYRKLIARKFDGTKQRVARGRRRVGQSVEDLVVKLARSNAGWGYAALWERRPIWDIRSPIKRSGTSFGGVVFRGTWEEHDVEGLHPFPYERSGGYRLLHGRGVDVARAGDVLRFVFHPSGYASCVDCGNH